MSDSDTPLAEAEDQTREERLLARLNGLVQYQDDLLDRVRRNQFSPYCHIPDLFKLDPEATRPYSVPSTFISEQVGGNVSVTNASEGFLANEPLDLMLGSFLPGGYKRRWEFEIWTGNFEPSSRPGFADIDPGLRMRTSESLNQILPDTDEEQYTPYQHDPGAVEVYIPNQFIVWNPSVGENGEITHYYWDDVNQLVRNRNPDDVPDDALRKLHGDPTSQFLWFKHLLDRGTVRDDYSLEDLTNGLFDSASFSDDAVFLKTYYATLLTLYGDDRTFSEVIRYRHEDDDKTAFVGSREESQVVLFDLEKSFLADLVDQTLAEGTPLYRDLQFSLLYRLLWDRLFFQEDALSHAFSVTPFFEALVAADYSLATTSSMPNSIFDASIDTIQDLLPSLLPRPDTRLGLLDYDEAQLDRYAALCDDYNSTLTTIFEQCSNPDRIETFAQHVLVHSLKHAVASWAAEYSAGGSEFEAWYDVNFQERDSDQIEIGIYDSIQGGAGVSKEIFDDIQSIDDDTLLTGIGAQGCCHIGATEETLLTVLRDHSGEYLFDLVEMAGPAGTHQTGDLRAAYTDLGSDYRHTDFEDVQPLVRRQLASVAETQELARFYAAVADEYDAVRDRLGRTPRPVDVVFALEDRTFFDTRVRQTYERFANRRSQRRDISELAERVEEITKQCVHACPDCLKRHSCTHQYRYQEQMLDRRLLTRSIATLEEDN
ncbi:hypothetical protein [Natronorubrum sp. A-ect3]|uniref:hypothetical protein n=1 Tax=Natronorubrum sp. A-ect3 TaxID=3242698 RepID=UPI00359DF7AF